MSFASKLWSPRSQEPGTSLETKPSRGPRATIARILGGARPATEPKPVTHELLFDSFAAKAGRELGDDEPTELSLANDPENLRQADRYIPTQPRTMLVDTKGKRHRARIINFSATGVAIEADFSAVPPDSVTHVGSMRVMAGRAMRHGMVYLFEKPLDPARCSPSTVL